jgi:hypothetical protein
MSLIHKSRHPGFLREVDLFLPCELDEEPIFRDSWRKMGLGWGAATAFALPTGETLAIVLSRTIAQGLPTLPPFKGSICCDRISPARR